MQLNITPELVGAVVGAVLSSFILIVQAVITGILGNRRDRIKSRKDHVERICITAVNMYRVEELLLTELEQCGKGKAGTLKKEFRLKALGEMGKESLLYPIRIKQFYQDLTNRPVPIALASFSDSQGSE